MSGGEILAFVDRWAQTNGKGHTIDTVFDGYQRTEFLQA